MIVGLVFIQGSTKVNGLNVPIVTTTMLLTRLIVEIVTISTDKGVGNNSAVTPSTIVN